MITDHDLRIWRADVSLKSVFNLHPNTPSSFIYIGEETLNKMASKRPEDYLAWIEDIQRNLKSQLYFAKLSDDTAVVACGVVDGSNLKFATYVLKADGDDFLLTDDLGGETVEGAEWVDMKVYRRERMWDSHRQVRTHTRKKTEGRVRPF